MPLSMPISNHCAAPEQRRSTIRITEAGGQPAEQRGVIYALTVRPREGGDHSIVASPNHGLRGSKRIVGRARNCLAKSDDLVLINERCRVELGGQTVEGRLGVTMLQVSDMKQRVTFVHDGQAGPADDQTG